MNKDLECALYMISRLARIAIRDRPGDELKRRDFYVDLLNGIKTTAKMAVRLVPSKKTSKPKSGKRTTARRKA